MSTSQGCCGGSGSGAAEKPRATVACCTGTSSQVQAQAQQASCCPPKGAAPSAAGSCCVPKAGKGAPASSAEETREGVSEYYGETLQSTADLKTSACLPSAERPSREVRRALGRVHDEIHQRYFGCGLAVPEVLEGCRALDLGCGAGRDVFVLAQMVSEKGSVTGVDMTAAQLDVARKHIDYHTKAFGYAQSNVKFVQGTLEELDVALDDTEQASYDVAISNCVINLVTDKERVLRHTYNLLKEGGEFYFSDVYASRRVPKHLTQDKVMYAEGLSGALYYRDLEAIARRVGFADPRIVRARAFAIHNEELAAKLEGTKYYSVTYRLFKHTNLEPSQEDYGQVALYKGTVSDSENAFALDLTHVFEAGRIVPVSGNTACMLQNTRLSQHFQVFEAEERRHFGPFEGGKIIDVPEAVRLGVNV